MKTCFKCMKEKPRSEFYKHSQMGDGYLGKCKECTKEDSRKHYRYNIDNYKDYERRRYQENPLRKIAIEKYAQTDAGRASQSRSKKKWIQNNPDKRAAHIILGNAIRRGDVLKPTSCESCGHSPKRIEGHHSDYTKPLEVIWLCRKCHIKAHS